MRIILHIGLPKTGSSALQYSFDTNRERLAEAGVFYAAQETPAESALGHITSGNGDQLLRHLIRDDRWPYHDFSDLPAAFERIYVDPRFDTTLISNEILSRVPPEMLQRFVDEVVAGRDLTVVAYIRDLYGHARSAWMQDIKRGGFGGDFATFLTEKYRPPQIRHLRRYEQVVGRERLRVVHYESNSKRLLPSFFEAAGIQVAGMDIEPPVINRSLSREEVDVLLDVFPLHRDRGLSQLLTDSLIDRHPGRPSIEDVDWSVVERLTARHSADVAWVNETFFDGRPVLRIEPSIRSASPPVAAATAEVWKDVVDILIGKIRQLEAAAAPVAPAAPPAPPAVEAAAASVAPAAPPAVEASPAAGGATTPIAAAKTDMAEICPAEDGRTAAADATSRPSAPLTGAHAMRRWLRETYDAILGIKRA